MFWKKSRPSNDYFVSIGAGINQIPLIREAKKAGFQVIAVDINPSAPGFYLCDLKIQESIEDYESIYVKLREMLVDGRISAIMTKSYGNAIITTAYLCEKFGLPFLPFEESKKFLNKKITKKIYNESGINTPRVITVTSRTKTESIKKELFPLIAKPQTGHAKVDITLLQKQADLDRFIKNHNPAEFIFEQFIEGDEVICAGYIHEGKYHHVLMSDKSATPLPFFADLLHTTPSKHQELVSETTATGQKIADAFNIQTAPLIMEFKVGADNELFLLEAVPEFGGEFIPDIMIPAATGYSFLGNTLRAASSFDFKSPAKIIINTAVAIKYITGTEGFLSSCATDSVNRMDSIVFTRIFKHIGDRISDPETNHERIGVIIASGKTASIAVENALNAEKEMNIIIKPAVEENSNKNDQ